MKTPAWIAGGPGIGPDLDASGELDRLLEAFSADPCDEGTFRRLEILLRGQGRWEIVPEDRTHTPSEKRP